jgi:Primase C terminal 1 (PriCT-1)
MPKHDTATCRLCEEIPADVFRRHWQHEPKAGYWHVIGDGPDLMARLPRQAHFVTILSYRPGPDGAPAHYHGPLYGEYDADDPSQAFADLRRCLELLHTEYDCPLEAIHVWHSGSRGPHWTIPAVVLGAGTGHPSLPRIYGAMSQQLFPPSIAPTLDRSIYSGKRGRMLRLPNRRRTDTGRYKVPLSIGEVLHKPYAVLEALTLRPRKGIFWPADDELSPCPALVQLYHEIIDTLVDVSPAQPHRTVDARIREGERNATLASLAGAMRRHGASVEAIRAALQAENQRRCDPPLPDKEVVGIAASIARYQPTVSATSRKSPATLGQWGGIRTLPTAEVSLWPR